MNAKTFQEPPVDRFYVLSSAKIKPISLHERNIVGLPDPWAYSENVAFARYVIKTVWGKTDPLFIHYQWDLLVELKPSLHKPQDKKQTADVWLFGLWRNWTWICWQLRRLVTSGLWLCWQAEDRSLSKVTGTPGLQPPCHFDFNTIYYNDLSFVHTS